MRINHYEIKAAAARNKPTIRKFDIPSRWPIGRLLTPPLKRRLSILQQHMARLTSGEKMVDPCAGMVIAPASRARRLLGPRHANARSPDGFGRSQSSCMHFTVCLHITQHRYLSWARANGRSGRRFSKLIKRGRARSTSFVAIVGGARFFGERRQKGIVPCWPAAQFVARRDERAIPPRRAR